MPDWTEFIPPAENDRDSDVLDARLLEAVRNLVQRARRRGMQEDDIYQAVVDGLEKE